MKAKKISFPVLHQIYEVGLGAVRDGIYWRRQGVGHELGDGAPYLLLVAQRSAPRRGRRPKGHGARKQQMHAYGLSADGKWYSIRWDDPHHALARTIAGAPYHKLGRARVGWLPTLKVKAAQALHAAMAEHLRRVKRCDLI